MKMLSRTQQIFWVHVWGVTSPQQKGQSIHLHPGGKQICTVALQVQHWWTFLLKSQPQPKAKMCAVDPANRLQTSQLSSVCLAFCTAHKQHWQAVFICLHSAKKKDFPRLKPNKLGSPVPFLEREKIQSDTFNLVSLDFVVVKRLLSFYLDSHFFTVGHTALCIRLTLLHCGFLLVWVKAAFEWFISSSHCQWQMGSKAFPWRTLSTPRGSLS